MAEVDVEAVARVAAGPVPDELVAAEARLRSAQLAADVDALDGLIHDDLLFTGPDGGLGTKAADLEAHRAGAVRFSSHQPLELRARPVGPDVVVTALLAELAVEVGGAPTGGTYRYTRVWQRQPDGRWQVVGGHVSEVGEPAG